MRAPWIARAAFAAMVVAATYPAWRLLWLDGTPTADEALQFLCGSRSVATKGETRPPGAAASTRAAP